LAAIISAEHSLVSLAFAQLIITPVKDDVP